MLRFCQTSGTLQRDNADLGAIQRIFSPLTTVIEACQDAGVQDFWSIQEYRERDQTRPSRPAFPAHTAALPGPLHQGQLGCSAHNQLQPLLNDRSEVFRKGRYGCFHNTTFPTLLRTYGIDTLVVTGVDLNVCVDTTVREAYMHDLDVIVLGDCVGGAHESWHETAFEVWERYFGVVTSSDVLLSLIEARTRQAGEPVKDPPLGSNRDTGA